MPARQTLRASALCYNCDQFDRHTHWNTDTMTVAASKVRTVCTETEAALVRASRKPELEQLSHAKVRQLAERAKKLSDKWQDVDRGQSRTRSRQTGTGVRDTNSALKAEIFRDALAAFQGRLAKLEAAGSKPAKSAAPAKSKRSAEHRATRAAVRQDLSDTKSELKAKQRAKKAKQTPKPDTAQPKVVAEAKPARKR